MKQEDKDLLLKDLCARLPYGVKAKGKIPINQIESKEIIGQVTSVHYNISIVQVEGFDVIVDYNPYFEIKPYLFPLSSMTDKLWDKEFAEYGITEFTRDSFKYGCETLDFNRSNPNLSNIVIFINQLIKNHFDIYGLIEKGLAIDATNLNIY